MWGVFLYQKAPGDALGTHYLAQTPPLHSIKVNVPESADLNIARQFMKDNGIEALAVEGSPLSSLVATLPDFSDADFDVSELKAH